MNIQIHKKLSEIKTNNIIVPIFKNEPNLKYLLGKKLSALVENIVKDKKDIFSIYISENQSLIILPIEKEIDNREILKLGKKTSDYFKKNKISDIAIIAFESVLKSKKNIDLTYNFIEALFIGAYSFEIYKTEKKNFKLNLVEVVSTYEKVSQNIFAKQKSLRKLIDSIYLAKDLVNTPPADLTPEIFANKIKESQNDLLSVEIFHEEDLKRKHFNLIYTVGKGSENRPCMAKIEYKGNPNSENNIALVGKGVTFDAGGTNLKPSGSIETMKMDMAGAALMFSLTKLISELKLPINVYTYIPLVENIIGYSAYKPGDILTSASGKTIEILNTDAEGRLILADALYEATKTNPEVIIDAATLTGACIVALGSQCAAVFSNDVSYSHKLTGISQKIYEDVWPLPLFKDYESRVKGDISDLRNIAKQKGEAGSTLAALFLKEFIDNKKWIHLDIAGPAFVSEPHPVLGDKATGFGIRLLLNFIKEEFCK